MTATALDNQSLFDIATRNCGGVEAAIILASVNDLSLTDSLPAGLILGVGDVLDKDIAEYYASKNIYPETAISAQDESQTIADEGIEFWAVEFDFMVS